MCCSLVLLKKSVIQKREIAIKTLLYFVFLKQELHKVLVEAVMNCHTMLDFLCVALESTVQKKPVRWDHVNKHNLCIVFSA